MILRTLVLLLLLVGCTGEDLAGRGDLELSASGGEALRSGFPYSEGAETFAFADGWELQFTRYLLAVGEIELTDPETGEVEAAWDEQRVVDLAAAPSGSEVIATVLDVKALRQDLSFTMDTPADDALADSPAAEDLELMRAQGWTHLIAGEAVKDERTVAFELGVSIPTRYYRCVNGKDQTEGIAIEASKTTGAFIYAHAHHIFWDTLAYGNEDLRFDAWAAVAGEDGVVTAEELATQDITDLLDEEGSPCATRAASGCATTKVAC